MTRAGEVVASASRAPAPALRGLVSYHGYDLRDVVPGRHRGLPSPYLTAVVTFGPQLELERPDGVRGRFAACVGGLHDVPERIVHDGRQSGIYLSVHPLAARTLFGVPAAALAAITVEADDVLGRLGQELARRVADAEDDGWDARFAALDDVLLRLLGRHDAAPSASDEVRHAWRALTAPDPGGVGDLARELGWSGDHLSRRFRAEFGVGPKLAARLARFDRARRDVARRAGEGVLALADVAVTHGYADQAHLAREFRSLAGCTATQWVDEEVHGGLVSGSAGGVVIPDDEGVATGRSDLRSPVH
ncbi:helix-turn-helix domain-containing protein [Actinomycetospora endophytica]|uniref:Helix-turn-helix domain-containing protein n=1 Tax=Actinomycetospora endophytica TaxID=2291215 RepID=A0ABS8P1X0_9PSEU|nr:helix-turn-helix domain-containing protein [Actinomycetospora endophytica]MCD2192242.1 helix-turn-helix domain-containing protein [Actinomycetospora endophytica]